MQFCCLGSGSKGNSTLVRHRQTLLMVDCGFSMKYTVASLAQKGCSAGDISAILVTHEHSDHIAGVSTLARRFNIPVYATPGTGRSHKLDRDIDIRWLELDEEVAVGDLSFCPVAVPHDANEPCQFVFQGAGKKLGILTDLGSVSDHVVARFANCHALLLEANHDLELLWAGPYPPSLKQRVAGDWGHLSNAQAADFLTRQSLAQLNTLVLGHISEQNNSLDRVRAHFFPYESQLSQVVYATQASGFDWLEV